MRKLFSIFSIVVFSCTIVFGQATVNILLVATEVTTQNLYVGLDALATTCLDPVLGETEAPPAPPPGSFHIVFDLSPYGCGSITTWNDYRFAPSFPYSGQVQHTLFWQRSATGTSISIQYNLPNGAAMTIKDILGLNILNLGPFTGTGTTTIPGSYPLTSAWVIMDYDVVPVELTSFTASVSEGSVILKWTTATELNNQGFEIERSTINQGWEKIGYVPGFGTTTEPKSYSFLDQNVTNGTYTYRLKQMDFDGTVSYSDEIAVEVDLTPDNFALFQNYPNPFNPTTTIQFQVPNVSDVSIVVYDMLGQEVRSLFADQVQVGKYTVEWDGLNFAGSKMSSGSYIYRMTAGEFVEVKEMILLK